jgi:hypothetical protein
LDCRGGGFYQQYSLATLFAHPAADLGVQQRPDNHKHKPYTASDYSQNNVNQKHQKPSFIAVTQMNCFLFTLPAMP